jgi:HEAT repeats
MPMIGMFEEQAAQALLQGWKNDPNTLPWLQELVKNDIEHLAIDEIIRGWKDHPDILPWFKNLAQHSKNYLRHAIFRVLAEEWKNDLDTLPILNHVVLYDEDIITRLCVISIIRQFYENDSDFLSIFKNCARNDNDSFVRHIALEALAKRRKYRTNIFDFLYCIVLDDPFQRQNPAEYEYNPRLTALRAVIKNYRDRSEVLDLLLDRSKNDPDEQVRKYAEEQLVKWRSKSS